MPRLRLSRSLLLLRSILPSPPPPLPLPLRQAPQRQAPQQLRHAVGTRPPVGFFEGGHNNSAFYNNPTFRQWAY